MPRAKTTSEAMRAVNREMRRTARAIRETIDQDAITILTGGRTSHELLEAASRKLERQRINRRGFYHLAALALCFLYASYYHSDVERWAYFGMGALTMDATNFLWRNHRRNR